MAGLTEIVATTYERREKTPADAVADNQPLLFKMREKGRIITINGGREIYEDLLFAQNSYVQSIDPTEEITLGYNQTITGFQFSPKIVVVPTVINTLEKAQNSGEGQFKDLLKTRLLVAESSLKNRFEAMLQGDGTGTSGKDYAGIKSYVVHTTTSGSIGGIERLSYTVIRNVSVNAPSTFTGTTNSSNIESRLRYTKNLCVRNTDKPTLCLAGATYFNAAGDAMSAKQRFVKDAAMAEAGFDNIVIEGMTMVLSGGKSFSGLTGRILDDECFLLNPETFALKQYKGFNMQPIPERVSFNQLVEVSIMVSIGNLTINNPGLNAVMFDT